MIGDRNCHSSEVGCQKPAKECKGDKISTFSINITASLGRWKRCATTCHYTPNCNFWQVRPKPTNKQHYECDLFRTCTNVEDTKANYILGDKRCNGIGKYDSHLNI